MCDGAGSCYVVPETDGTACAGGHCYRGKCVPAEFDLGPGGLDRGSGADAGSSDRQPSVIGIPPPESSGCGCSTLARPSRTSGGTVAVAVLLDTFLFGLLLVGRGGRARIRKGGRRSV